MLTTYSLSRGISFELLLLNKPKFLEALAFLFIPAVVCKHSAHTNTCVSLGQWDFVSVSILALQI